MAGQFTLDVSKWVAKAKGRTDLVVRKIALDMFSRVILRSPVGNPDLWQNPAPPGYVGGRFRGNWQVAIGEVPEGTLDLTDPSGNAAMSRMTAVAMGVRAGQVITLVNNLPYARSLEDGWSKQAPNGMVKLTVIEFGGVVEKAANEARSERP